MAFIVANVHISFLAKQFHGLVCMALYAGIWIVIELLWLDKYSAALNMNSL